MSNTKKRNEAEIERLAKELLSKMTLEEKVGQLCQSVGADIVAIGTTKIREDVEDLIRRGRIGSMIQVDEPLAMSRKIRHFQEIAVNESRLGIPLMFCQDVIHGYETAFPIPLASACSFDPEKIEKESEIAAKEAVAAGLSLTFAPMVDIVRDPRWGRVAESSGEDPYLGSAIARARVRGLKKGGIACCLKHFAGYGAAEAGRDYNTVEISETTLNNIYLPPFRAGIEEGAEFVMAAFNTMDGVPVTASRHMLTEVLRNNLGFRGLVISDYSAVMELIMHAVAENEQEAAFKAFTAGLDIEMTTNYFIKYLPTMVNRGLVSEESVDASALRMLKAKYRLGLMDDPFCGIDEEALSTFVFSSENRKESEKLAEESIVLLENDGILPLKKDKKIALIGPLASSDDLLGTWQFSHRRSETVTLCEGLEREGYTVLAEKGSDILSPIEGGIERALDVAGKADVVIFALGESSPMSGEASSRQNIEIPSAQKALFEAVSALDKPSVLLVTSGRPLVLTEYRERVSAMLEIWHLGSNEGNAVAGVISGRVNPSGSLSMSFPSALGQVPIYYNELPTGRPFTLESGERFQSKWIDGQNPPLYPFGYGLSYSDIRVTGVYVQAKAERGEKVKVLVTAENFSEVKGEKVIQLYIRDCFASISRPVRELRGFMRTAFKGKEKKVIEFTLTDKELGFYHRDGSFVVEDGTFLVAAGTSARKEDQMEAEF